MPAFRIQIRPLASGEIIEAYDWYELQREGLGFEFLDELENFYENLLRNPHTHSFYSKPIRQGKVNRFPYVVVYEVHGQDIVIYSVFMTRQDPKKKRSG